MRRIIIIIPTLENGKNDVTFGRPEVSSGPPCIRWGYRPLMHVTPNYKSRLALYFVMAASPEPQLPVKGVISTKQSGFKFVTLAFLIVFEIKNAFLQTQKCHTS